MEDRVNSMFAYDLGKQSAVTGIELIKWPGTCPTAALLLTNVSRDHIRHTVLRTQRRRKLGAQLTKCPGKEYIFHVRSLGLTRPIGTRTI